MMVRAMVDGYPNRTYGVSRGASARRQPSRLLTSRTDMLWTLVTILLILWLLGMLTSYTLGGLIHVLLVIAVIVVLVRVIKGQNVV